MRRPQRVRSDKKVKKEKEKGIEFPQNVLCERETLLLVRLSFLFACGAMRPASSYSDRYYQ
jgi:hypothetical protein